MFTNKITEVLHFNNWEKLHKLKLNCLQRLRKRYILYDVKVTQEILCQIWMVQLITKYESEIPPKYGTQRVKETSKVLQKH